MKYCKDLTIISSALEQVGLSVISIFEKESISKS